MHKREKLHYLFIDASTEQVSNTGGEMNFGSVVASRDSKVMGLGRSPGRFWLHLPCLTRGKSQAQR